MAYKKFIDFSAEPLVMVIDWGAGTLDFFIAHFLMGADGRPKVVENVPAYGVRELGGIDMDDVLARRFKELHGIGDLTDVEENQLKSWVEESKKALSKQESVTQGDRPKRPPICLAALPHLTACWGRWQVGMP